MPAKKCSSGCGTARFRAPGTALRPCHSGLGLKALPLIRAHFSAPSSRAEGQGTRFFRIDPLPGGLPLWPLPAVYPCRTTIFLSPAAANEKKAGAAGWYFGFPAYPSPLARCAIVTTPRAQGVAISAVARPTANQHSELLKSCEPPRGSARGSFLQPETQKPR